MPIIASVTLNKLPETVFSIINYFRKKDDIEIITIDINGYLFYKYRGMLFVRRAISHTFFRKDMHLLKNYLDYIIHYLAREDSLAWTRTVFIMEIIIDLRRSTGSTFTIVIEISNEENRGIGHIKVKPLLGEGEEEEDKTLNEEIINKDSELPEEIEEIDSLVEEEDLKKIAPIDIYRIFTPKEVNEILEIFKRFGAKYIISDTEEEDYILS